MAEQTKNAFMQVVADATKNSKGGLIIIENVEEQIAKATGDTVYLDAVAKIREVIGIAQRLGWEDRYPNGERCMHLTAVEKVLLMALYPPNLERFERDSHNTGIKRMNEKQQAEKWERFKRQAQAERLVTPLSI